MSDKEKKILIKIYDREMLDEISSEVEKSGLKTRNRFCNETFRELLLTPSVFDKPSKLEELREQRCLWEKLPCSLIRELAPIHNRTFEQMLIHVIQRGLQPYLGHNPSSPID